MWQGAIEDASWVRVDIDRLYLDESNSGHLSVDGHDLTLHTCARSDQDSWWEVLDDVLVLGEQTLLLVAKEVVVGGLRLGSSLLCEERGQCVVQWLLKREQLLACLLLGLADVDDGGSQPGDVVADITSVWEEPVGEAGVLGSWSWCLEDVSEDLLVFKSHMDELLESNDADLITLVLFGLGDLLEESLSASL